MKIPYNRETLIKHWDSDNQFGFYLFYGHKPPLSGVDASCFSQWFVRSFIIDEIEYPTAEHWMMAEKARLFEDEIMLEAILNTPGPREAKAFGRQVKNFENTIWAQHRSKIVRRGNYEKFTQNQDLKEFLLGTEAGADENNETIILVEAAGRDTIWGIGLGENNPKSRDPLLWRGLNLLGFALTEVREQIKKEELGD